MKVRTPDRAEKQGVASKQAHIVEREACALYCVTGGAECSQLGKADFDAVTVGHGSEIKLHALLRRYQQLCASLFCEHFRSGQMIGMHVCFKHGADAPSVLLC